jgi:hypothetical protein
MGFGSLANDFTDENNYLSCALLRGQDLVFSHQK